MLQHLTVTFWFLLTFWGFRILNFLLFQMVWLYACVCVFRHIILLIPTPTFLPIMRWHFFWKILNELDVFSVEYSFWTTLTNQQLSADYSYVIIVKNIPSIPSTLLPLSVRLEFVWISGWSDTLSRFKLVRMKRESEREWKKIRMAFARDILECGITIG